MKTFLSGLGLLAIAVLLICTLSCDSGSSSDASSGSSSEEVGDTGVSEDVAETAEGIFDMIDEYMMVDDPSVEDYPSGLSVVENSAEKYTMTLTGFSPEDGVSVSGQLVLEQTKASPLTLVISGTLAATGEVALTVRLNVSATFDEGEGPPDDDPTSMSGTFTYNGTGYDILKVFEAIDILEDEEEAEEEAFDPEDIPDYETVRETAIEVFNIIGLLMEDPVSYPDGITVSETESTATMTLVEYSPEDGLFISGTITVNVEETDPLALAIVVALDYTGTIIAEVTTNAVAEWTTGEPGVDLPSTGDSIFRFNDYGYTLDYLLKGSE